MLCPRCGKQMYRRPFFTSGGIFPWYAGGWGSPFWGGVWEWPNVWGGFWRDSDRDWW